MADAKTKVGKVPCPVCGLSVWLRSNATGTVSIDCPECDAHLFAKRGTDAHAALSSAAGAKAAEPARPAEEDRTPKAPTAPAAAPAPKAKAGFWDGLAS
jgi:uncharacterized Zn finger protein (UPF0148 family)